MVPQGEIRDALGQPLTTKNEYGVEGSAYMFDMYLPGRITVKGKSFANLNIKLNLEKNIVFFEKDGVEMVPTGNVSAVEFFDVTTNRYTHVFRNGFPEINNNTSQTYYQVLDSGKAMLLKHIGMISRESRQYAEATVVRRYEQVKTNYFFINGQLISVKKTDEVLEAFKEKKAEVQNFINSNRLKLNREADQKSIVAFYNKL